MSVFKVGQRVRVIAQEPESVIEFGPLVGLEATVHAVPYIPGDCAIRFDGDNRNWACWFHQLAPLTDPRADEFIADMQRFAHVAKTTKVPA